MVRILVADSRLVVRNGLRALIESRDDFEICAEASDGREAIDRAVRYRPDVAILDVMLPTVDCIEVTRRIREKTPATEVMIFTLDEREYAVRGAIRAGARGCVRKWEPDDRIIAAIEILARHGEFYSSPLAEQPFGPVPDPGRPAEQTAALTLREREIVSLIADGKGNKRIAHQLGISTKTVEAHRSASMRKLGAHSTAQLVRYAIRRGLIQP
jgi:DNA-binding NarL/FixJ family response regulator